MLRAPVTIGPGAYTGAGSVVLHDVPENVTVAGAPARELKRMAKPGGQEPADHSEE
jgi:acetyltransferase-like isoleucine patch superfamily enzyme